MKALRVSPEARGQVRVLLRTISALEAELLAKVRAIPKATITAAQRRDFGARLALRRVVGRMPIAPVFSGSRVAVWGYLSALPSLSVTDNLDAADDQPAVAVMALLLGVPDRPALVPQPFGMAVTQHALARLLDRTAFTADPYAAVLAAHQSLLNTDGAVGEKLLALPQLIIPAGRGFFCCGNQTIDGAPFVVARTWIHADQAKADQTANLAAWHTLLQPGGRTPSL